MSSIKYLTVKEMEENSKKGKIVLGNFKDFFKIRNTTSGGRHIFETEFEKILDIPFYYKVTYDFDTGYTKIETIIDYDTGTVEKIRFEGWITTREDMFTLIKFLRI